MYSKIMIRYMITDHFFITLIFCRVIYYLVYCPQTSKYDAQRKTWFMATCYFQNTTTILLLYLYVGNVFQYEAKTRLKRLVRHAGSDA